MRYYYVPALVTLWLVGWASLPNAGAAHSLQDVDSQPHKVITRLILIAVLALWWAKDAQNLRRNGKPFLLPLAFFAYNILLLPVSAQPGYSGFRLVEFGLVVGTAAFIVLRRGSEDMFRRRLIAFFATCTVAIALLSILFIINPELGGKAAGWDPVSHTFRYRLGGTLLRVDLVAALAGVCTMFWLFAALLGRWTSAPVALMWLAGSLTGLVLSYSRSSLILATAIGLFFIARDSRRKFIKLILLTGVAVSVFLLGFDQISNFYLRGETQENVASLSGRTFIAGALLAANNWQSMILGNGYLMNSPAGLYFSVSELGADMASPHDGYLAVLLGSGVVGVALVVMMHVRCIFWFRQRRSFGARTEFGWTMPAYLFLTGITAFDYGVWGVTSPALLAFFILYFTLWRARKLPSVWPVAAVRTNMPQPLRSSNGTRYGILKMQEPLVDTGDPHAS